MSNSETSPIDEATDRELLNALVEGSENVERDYTGFFRGYTAAVAFHTNIDVEKNADIVMEEIIDFYITRLNALGENGGLEEMLEDFSNE